MSTTNPLQDSFPYEGPWIPLVNLGMWLVDGPRSLVQSSDPEGMNGLFLHPSDSLRLCYWDFGKPVPEIVIHTWILFRKAVDFESSEGTRWILRAAEWDRGGDKDRWKAQGKRLFRLTISATHLSVDDEFAAKFQSDIRRLGWPLAQDLFGVTSRAVEVTDIDTRFDVRIKCDGNSLVVASTVFKQDVELFNQIEQLHHDLESCERSAGRVDDHHEVFEWCGTEPTCTLSVDELPYAFDCYDWESYWKWKGGADPTAPAD